MDKNAYSQAYLQVLRQGPFPGRIDPWAEAGRYFQQIHAGMIGDLMENLQAPLEVLGYVAGRETSLQIAERSQPDIYVHERENASVRPVLRWDYATAAAEILAEPGVALDWELPELDAVYVKERGTSLLVTVIEVVSPRNKIDQNDIAEYRERRERLLRKGVNLMEIDPTRSVKRLLADRLADTYAYHVAVYLPEQLPRLIGIDFGQPLKRVALPLRGEVLPMELQTAYDHAYLAARIAVHILDAGHYNEQNLPFLTLLSSSERQEALAAVAAWQAELNRLQVT